MRLKIAVSDACIFIDLYGLDLITAFFRLDIEIHTTSSILYELCPEQYEMLEAYHSLGMLTIHNLKEDDFVEMNLCSYPKSLSEADKSVLHIANKLNACVLSGDKIIRDYAKNKDIKCHGLVWIFDKLVDANILTKKDAASKLKEFTVSNFIFQNNQPLVAIVEKRLMVWDSVF